MTNSLAGQESLFARDTGCRDYDGGEPTIEQRRFARWVNNKALFKSCDFNEMKGGSHETIT